MDTFEGMTAPTQYDVAAKTKRSAEEEFLTSKESHIMIGALHLLRMLRIIALPLV